MTSTTEFEKQADPHSPSNSTVVDKGLGNELGQNSCFLNSAVQVLWHLDVFRQSFKHLSQHCCLGDACIFCALKVLFGQFESSGNNVLTADGLRQALAETFRDEHKFQLGGMQDAAECFEVLLTYLHHHLGMDGVDGMCSSPCCIPHIKFASALCEQCVCCLCGAASDPLPYHQMVHYVSCKALCMEAEQRKSESREPINFSELLRHVSGSGIVRCCPAGCGAKTRLHRVLTNSPEVLALGLIWDSEQSHLILDVLHLISTRLCLSDLFSQVMKEKARKELHLVGLVCYYGHHYITFFHRSSHGCWVYFDDAQVKEIGRQWGDVVAKCSQGHFQPLLLLYTDPKAVPLSPTSAHAAGCPWSLSASSRSSDAVDQACDQPHSKVGVCSDSEDSGLVPSVLSDCHTDSPNGDTMPRADLSAVPGSLTCSQHSTENPEMSVVESALLSPQLPSSMSEISTGVKHNSDDKNQGMVVRRAQRGRRTRSDDLNVDSVFADEWQTGSTAEVTGKTSDCSDKGQLVEPSVKMDNEGGKGERRRKSKRGERTPELGHEDGCALLSPRRGSASHHRYGKGSIDGAWENGPACSELDELEREAVRKARERERRRKGSHGSSGTAEDFNPVPSKFLDLDHVMIDGVCEKWEGLLSESHVLLQRSGCLENQGDLAAALCHCNEAIAKLKQALAKGGEKVRSVALPCLRESTERARRLHSLLAQPKETTSESHGLATSCMGASPLQMQKSVGLEFENLTLTTTEEARHEKDDPQKQVVIMHSGSEESFAFRKAITDMPQSPPSHHSPCQSLLKCQTDAVVQNANNTDLAYLEKTTRHTKMDSISSSSTTCSIPPKTADSACNTNISPPDSQSDESDDTYPWTDPTLAKAAVAAQSRRSVQSLVKQFSVPGSSDDKIQLRKLQDQNHNACTALMSDIQGGSHLDADLAITKSDPTMKLDLLNMSMSDQENFGVTEKVLPEPTAAGMEMKLDSKCWPRKAERGMDFFNEPNSVSLSGDLGQCGVKGVKPTCQLHPEKGTMVDPCTNLLQLQCKKWEGLSCFEKHYFDVNQDNERSKSQQPMDCWNENVALPYEVPKGAQTDFEKGYSGSFAGSPGKPGNWINEELHRTGNVYDAVNIRRLAKTLTDKSSTLSSHPSSVHKTLKPTVSSTHIPVMSSHPMPVKNSTHGDCLFMAKPLRHSSDIDEVSGASNWEDNAEDFAESCPAGDVFHLELRPQGTGDKCSNEAQSLSISEFQQPQPGKLDSTTNFNKHFAKQASGGRDSTVVARRSSSEATHSVKRLECALVNKSSDAELRYGHEVQRNAANKKHISSMKPLVAATNGEAQKLGMQMPIAAMEHHDVMFGAHQENPFRAVDAACTLPRSSDCRPPPNYSIGYATIDRRQDPTAREQILKYFYNAATHTQSHDMPHDGTYFPFPSPRIGCQVPGDPYNQLSMSLPTSPILGRGYGREYATLRRDVPPTMYGTRSNNGGMHPATSPVKSRIDVPPSFALDNIHQSCGPLHSPTKSSPSPFATNSSRSSTYRRELLSEKVAPLYDYPPLPTHCGLPVLPSHHTTPSPQNYETLPLARYDVPPDVDRLTPALPLVARLAAWSSRRAAEQDEEMRIMAAMGSSTLQLRHRTGRPPLPTPYSDDISLCGPASPRLHSFHRHICRHCGRNEAVPSELYCLLCWRSLQKARVGY
uniref:uncharacterized protein isoform X2 n=1 Tax=Myxine glutinosa TaxID=7769 RepID=UPI00358E95E0